MATAQPKMKAYVSNFIVHLGPITMNGRLLGVKKPGAKSKQSPFVMATPAGEPVVQRYIVDGKPDTLYEPSDLTRAVKKDDGTLAVVEHSGVVADAKKSDLPKDVLNITVHPADSVDGAIYTDANSYVFEPDASDPVNLQWHALMLRLLDSDNYAFLGVCNLRNNEGLFKLTLWRNRIVVQQMVFPENVNDHGALESDLTPDVSKDALKKATSMVTKLAVPFDAGSYVDATREKLHMLADVVTATTGPKKTAKKKTAPKGDDFDLAAALDAFA